MRSQLLMRNGVVKSAQAHAADMDRERQALLKEVREVLNVTSKRKLSDGPCWCKSYLPTLGHTEDCQRARQLAGRLRVEGRN
jgi:hypothetical protein